MNFTKYKYEIIVISIVLITVSILYKYIKINPVPGSNVSSGYGMRTLSGNTHFHNGIDLAAPTGTKVKSILSGKVETVGFDNLNGNYVKIKHHKNSSFYGHLNKTNVKPGQYIFKGQKIGEVGNTGYSFGSHVHFIIWDSQGQTVDPLKTNLIRV